MGAGEKPQNKKSTNVTQGLLNLETNNRFQPWTHNDSVENIETVNFFLENKKKKTKKKKNILSLSLVNANVQCQHA